MRSSNPVLTRLTPETPTGYAAPAGYQTSPSYQPPTAVDVTDRMTIDDVVVRTVTLLALTGISATATWILVKDPGALFGAMLAGAMIGLVLGLIITFKRITNPPLIIAYALVEGVFVGAISKFYETRFQGIVLTAVAATFGIFLVMSMLYKFRVIRNSPRFTRGLTAAVIGVFGVILVNFILSLFGITTGLRGNADGSVPWFAIVFSLVVIVIASLTFILDFDLIEQSVRHGAPRVVAWTCAFGLLVGLIWVYLEVLRLLSYFRGR